MSDGTEKDRPRVPRIAAMAILAALLLLPPVEVRLDPNGLPALGPTLAHADDDDDDDGGGGGGGSGGGGGGGSPSAGSGGGLWRLWSDRPRAERKRTPRQAAPARAPAPLARPEVVAVGLTEADVATLGALGFAEVRQATLPDGDRLSRLSIPRGSNPEAAAALVVQTAPWASAAPNHFFRNQATECGAEICRSWTQIGWRPAAAGPACRGSGVRIGVVDTSVNEEHDALDGARLSVVRFGDAEERPSGEKHGTAVVALFAGRPDSRVPGLLPDAEILVADPFTRSGAGDERTDAYALVQALEHLVDVRVDVVNLSLAGPENDVLAETIDRALDRGVALVAAAGNQGPGGDPLYPAAYAGVVAVTAVDGRNRLYRRANRGGHIDFAAPGVDVPTAASVRGVRPQTGTSFATPFVTAALAARLRAEPGLVLSRAVEALSGETLDLGEAGHDPLYGWGLVQVRPGC